MADGAWGVNASGNWSASSNWTSSIIADGATFTATFQRDITAARTVTVDTMRTIGNLVFQDTVATIFNWILARSLTNTLTLDNGASKPLINTPTQIIVTGVLAGTNGFEKQGAGFLELRAANTVSGIVIINGGSVRLGQFQTGATDFLPSISSYDIVAGVLDYRGTGVYTETSSISGTNSSQIYIARPSTITFSNALSDFFGTISLESQTTGTTANFGNNVPANAQSFQISAYTTSATFGTFVFANESSVNVVGNASLYTDSVQTGSSLTFTGDGTAPIEFSGTFSRHSSSNTGSTITLQLNGSSSSCSVTGRIRNNTTGTPAGTLALTKSGTGTWSLSNDNDYSGRTLTSSGKLVAQSNTALGTATSSAGVTISGTGVLELAGGITLDKSSTPFTIHQTSPIVSVGNNTVRTAGVTLGGTTTFEVTTGNRLAISNTGAITDGASTFGITKTGDGELALAAFTNTYDGVVVVSAGTLAIGSQGALGNGNVTLTGTLKYTGTGETYSRSTFLSGAAPSLEAAGSGAITVTNLSQDSTTKTLTLKGANTGANTVTVALSDSSNPLSLAKSGAGKWVTTGALSYSGSTTVSDGTLRVQTANSNTTSGAVTIGANGAVELVTDTLASTGGGAVLGSSHVAVNGGIIKTRGGTTQKGQMRYGGNLTFGADSSLYIGAAA